MATGAPNPHGNNGNDRMRSLLFTPATKPERFAKAAQAGADVLIIDLEDSVAPADKEKARSTALDYLSNPHNSATTTALRINGLDTAYGLADLAACVNSSAVIDLLVLPKIEDAGFVHIVDKQLEHAGKPTLVIAMIESARGLTVARDIALACRRVCALMFGAADMSADLGADAAWEPLFYSRSALIASCAPTGIPVIDAPYFDVHDLEGLGTEVTRSRALGFIGKCAIHPVQIAPINKSYTPSAEDVARARSILKANLKGVGLVNGQMVDEAVARHARHVLAAAGESFEDQVVQGDNNG